jgi:enoyl-CoA hydratase/carnithine racemase
MGRWRGLAPGGGPMARLPRLIGRGRALEVLMEQGFHKADDVENRLGSTLANLEPE